MSVKISELPILASLADNDVIAGVDTSANVTSKIEMATLKNYIDTNTQYTAGTNIDITNNVISAPDVYNKDEMDSQIEELQSEVDSLSTIYNAFPTESGEGESLTLDDTAEVKFKKFDLKGNTSQTTYSGKNLLNNTLLTTTVTKNGITATPHSDGSITFNGTATTLSFFNLSQQDFGENGFNSETGGAGLYVATDGGTLRMAYDPSNHYTYIQVNNGASLNNVIIYPMIRLKTITDDTYEPYVGETASPNPSYPQPVNVVSGDNEINVCGKNLWGSEEHGTIDEQTGVDVYNANRWRTIGYLNVTPNTQYTLSSNANSNIYYIFYYYDSGKTFISSQPAVGKESVTKTTPNNCYYMRCVIADTASTKTTQRQLEVGSSATTYEPYQGNTYNIDLPEGMELCKIGNYQDYFYKDSGKWYLHKEIGKVVLNGSETVEKVANGKFRAVQSIDFGQYGYGTSNQMYSNYFKNNANYATYTTGEGYAWNYYIYFGLETSVTTTTDAQTWLTNNTPTFYGILATPTNTEITYQSLIEQLNAIEQAQSKENQTNISQVNNDKPFILDVTAIKSLQNVLDRIELLES